MDQTQLPFVLKKDQRENHCFWIFFFKRTCLLKSFFLKVLNWKNYMPDIWVGDLWWMKDICCMAEKNKNYVIIIIIIIIIIITNHQKYNERTYFFLWHDLFHLTTLYFFGESDFWPEPYPQRYFLLVFIFQSKTSYFDYCEAPIWSHYIISFLCFLVFSQHCTKNH